MGNQEYLGYQDKPGNQDSKCNKRNCESKENQGKKVYQGKPENKGNLVNQPEALCHLLHFRASLSPSLSQVDKSYLEKIQIFS